MSPRTVNEIVRLVAITPETSPRLEKFFGRVHSLRSMCRALGISVLLKSASNIVRNADIKFAPLILEDMSAIIHYRAVLVAGVIVA